MRLLVVNLSPFLGFFVAIARVFGIAGVFCGGHLTLWKIVFTMDLLVIAVLFVTMVHLLSSPAPYVPLLACKLSHGIKRCLFYGYLVAV